ncbi:unnamed protein product [Schistosoma mattheei]|uniref:Uncharacterized protein n=1 Tax=Schistosoma mattheei TaxID=31246 RepID=A0A183PYA0_9TREM|nr:unnamed protein product [Schistosoma mattheei]
MLRSDGVGGSKQETLDPAFVLLGTRQQGVPVVLRELVLPDGFDPVPPRLVATLQSGRKHLICTKKDLTHMTLTTTKRSVNCGSLLRLLWNRK